MNLLVVPKAVADNQLTNGKNCWPIMDGQLAKRHPMLVDRLMVTDYASGFFCPLTMFVPDKITGFDFIIHYTDGDAEYLAAGTWDHQTVAQLVQVTLQAHTQTSFTPVTFTTYKGAVIAVGGGIEGFYQLVKNGAGTYVWSKCYFNYDQYFIDLGAPVPSIQPQSSQIRPKVACVYKGRMHYFNLGLGMESWMVAADRSDYQLATATKDRQIQLPLASQIGPDVLATNGRHFEFAVIEGEEILSAEEISTNPIASALETALLVKTNKRAIVCTGELSESTDTGTTYNSYLGDFKASKVNYDAGTFGPQAHCRAPNGTFWASPDDVYVVYDGEPRPRAIGTNIRPVLAAVPPELRKLVHMAYADGCVYLSIPTADSTSEVITVVNHWRLDLRPHGDGDELTHPETPNQASWWGPQDYSAYGTLNPGLPMGVCIVEKDGTIYSAGHPILNSVAAGGPTLFTFNKGAGGRDILHVEVTSAPAWKPFDAGTNPAYAVGDIISPSPLARNGRLYVCTIGGAPGAVEPAWPNANGAAVVDNAVTWTEILNGALLLALPTLNSQQDASFQMAPDFKELDLGNRMVDKVFKRGDISAYFNVHQQAWLELIVNGGNLKQFAGPVFLGDFTLGRIPAMPDLGLLVLDVSSLAQEFQARQFRPNGASRSSPYPAFGYNDIEVIRGRAIQPKFRDGSGFVVDDTNDYIVFTSFSVGGAVGTTYQVQVAHGVYDNANTLLQAIIDAMNAIGTNLDNITGTAGQWNYASAFGGLYPYMTTFTLGFGVRTAGWGVAFVTATDATESYTNVDGSTLYVNRCARLLSALGFDTGSAVQDALAIVPTVHGNPVHLVAEQVNPTLVSPTRIAGVQSIPYLRSPVVVIDQLTVDLVVKKGRPLPITARTS